MNEAPLGDGVARHWYHRVKSEALDHVVGPPPATVLDVGAGGGFFSRHLLERGAGQAVRVDPGCDADSDREHAGGLLLLRRAAPAAPPDLILMVDVPEHVDDDTALAAGYIRSARFGTRVVVTMPAFTSDVERP